MVSIKVKTINGKRYLYAEYSFRLPDGKIKKLSKLIKKENEKNSKEFKEYLLKKEIEFHKKYALDTFKTDSILDKKEFEKIEEIKVKYREIIKKLNKKQLKDILDRFTINFTYESNAIEGNSLTLKDVTLILTEKVVPKGKDLREVYETKNTREAHDLLFNNKLKIEIDNILKLHKVIVKDTDVNFGFKKLPNFLVMRNVKTTPPERVKEEMETIINWYNENKGKMHPLKLASHFHGKFEKIHPFEDGNGRVGRILINVILLENGYPPLIIRKTTRASYLSCLEAFDNKHWEKLERFLLEKLKHTFRNFFEIYVKYL